MKWPFISRKRHESELRSTSQDLLIRLLGLDLDIKMEELIPSTLSHMEAGTKAEDTIKNIKDIFTDEYMVEHFGKHRGSLKEIYQTTFRFRIGRHLDEIKSRNAA